MAVTIYILDLRRDPGERYNVLGNHADVVEELLQIAKEARDDLGDSLEKQAGKNRRLPGEIEE